MLMPRTAHGRDARVTSTVPVISCANARRLLLGAQGLLDDPARRGAGGLASVAKLIERMGLVQIDTINVVERAHHLILATRIEGYDRSSLDALQSPKHHRIFEHWTHDASYIPTIWYPHWRRRFAGYEPGNWFLQRLGENPEKVIADVLERVRREGPLRSKDFEHNGGNNGSAAWWGWKPQKAALEYLWRRGDLYVLGRESFQKVYDLTERAVPQLLALPEPSDEEHVSWACRSALERLGVASAKEVRDFWNAIPITSVKECLREAACRGEVIEVMVESCDGSPPRPAFALSDVKRRIANLRHAPAIARLLCPFDPVLRDRARAKRLFNFDYRFEAFVPKGKRVHGYYVMPLLLGDQLIGRVDPKLHRDRGELEIRFIHFEHGLRLTPKLRAAAMEAIERLAKFVGAEKICLPQSFDE